MLGIAHSGEIEPGRTEGGRGCITRFGGEHFGNPLWLFPPRAHINKRANDVSHHVLQKALAVMRTPTNAPRRTILSSLIVRTGVLAWHSDARKLVKSLLHR